MKKDTLRSNQHIPQGKPKTKFVKKANMFCKTEWKNGKQVITWYNKEEYNTQKHG